MCYIGEDFLMRPGSTCRRSFTAAGISGFSLTSLSSASQFYCRAPPFALHRPSISAISLCYCPEKAIGQSCAEFEGNPLHTRHQSSSLSPVAHKHSFQHLLSNCLNPRRLVFVPPPKKIKNPNRLTLYFVYSKRQSTDPIRPHYIL